MDPEVVQLRMRIMALEAYVRKADKLLREIAKNLGNDNCHKDVRQAAKVYLQVFEEAK